MIVALNGKTLVMGIVNVTPDSFFDGGRHNAPDSAIAHALRLVEEGADLLDIGGESTRPGSDPVALDEELSRVVPVIRELARKTGVPISIDTNKAEVARAALDAGATWINDVSAGTMDPPILAVAAEAGVPFIAMHMRGKPRSMQVDTKYDDLVPEMLEYFRDRLRVFEAAGIDRSCVILDPGIGFGKSPEAGYTILARLEEFRSLGLPLLVGPSRKSFLRLVGAEDLEDRLPGTLAAVTICAMAGVEVVRVHDVAQAVQVVRVTERVRKESAARL